MYANPVLTYFEYFRRAPTFVNDQPTAQLFVMMIHSSQLGVMMLLLLYQAAAAAVLWQLVVAAAPSGLLLLLHAGRVQRLRGGLGVGGGRWDRVATAGQ